MMIRQDKESLTIGQLAKAAGVPTTTVRYYERAGLLKPEARSGSNYRHYTSKSLHRLRFIRTAQSAGLSLDDVSSLIRLTEDRKKPCAEVQGILRQRLIEIGERMRELRSVQSAVEKALADCRCGPREGLCADIDRLAGKSA